MKLKTGLWILGIIIFLGVIGIFFLYEEPTRDESVNITSEILEPIKDLNIVTRVFIA